MVDIRYRNLLTLFARYAMRRSTFSAIQISVHRTVKLTAGQPCAATGTGYQAWSRIEQPKFETLQGRFVGLDSLDHLNMEPKGSVILRSSDKAL